MKTLVLVRHAKSSWDNASMTDFDRPLNDRGKRDAPAMAGRLKKKLPDLRLLVSSPAKRAKKTAEYFAEEFGLPADQIVFIPELYQAPAPRYYEIIAAFPDEQDQVALFAHNPGITYFASQLTELRIDNMPTCALFAVSVNTGSWTGFREATKQFLFFDYPKLTD